MDADNEWAASNARKNITMLYNKIEKVDTENTELKKELKKGKDLVEAMMDLVKDFVMNKGGGAYSDNLDIVLMRQMNALVVKAHGVDPYNTLGLNPT